MPRLIALLVLVVLAGCGPKTATLNKMSEAPSKTFALEVEYAPHHQAAFSWDQTGVSGTLRGDRTVDGIVVFIQAGPHSRRFIFSATGTGLTLVPSLSPDQFRWTTDEAIKQLAGAYHRQFWISWKALGLEGLPQGAIEISVYALSPQAPGAVFRAAK